MRKHPFPSFLMVMTKAANSSSSPNIHCIVSGNHWNGVTAKWARSWSQEEWAVPHFWTVGYPHPAFNGRGYPGRSRLGYPGQVQIGGYPPSKGWGHPIQRWGYSPWQVVPPQGYPVQRWGTTTLSRGTHPPHGIPPAGGKAGHTPLPSGRGTTPAGVPHPAGGTPVQDNRMEYLIHCGWYTSCVYTGGLSCCVCFITKNYAVNNNISLKNKKQIFGSCQGLWILSKMYKTTRYKRREG